MHNSKKYNLAQHQFLEINGGQDRDRLSGCTVSKIRYYMYLQVKECYHTVVHVHVGADNRWTLFILYRNIHIHVHDTI